MQAQSNDGKLRVSDAAMAMTSSTLRLPPQLPDIPKSLKYLFWLARLFPGVVQALLALAFWALPPLPQASRLIAWIQDTYGVAPHSAALVFGAFALGSLVWAVKREPLERYPVLDVLGAIWWTLPLFCFVGLSWWYGIAVQPESTKTFVILYGALVVALLMLYALGAYLTLWIMQVKTAWRLCNDHVQR